MKTELKIPESKGELKFPLLATACVDMHTVLFSDSNTGTVVNPGRSTYCVGAHRKDWVDPITADVWTIHPPGTQLIITQE